MINTTKYKINTKHRIRHLLQRLVIAIDILTQIRAMREEQFVHSQMYNGAKREKRGDKMPWKASLNMNPVLILD